MAKSGRKRADSVLGNRMEAHSDFQKMKVSMKRWPQLSQLLAKKSNKVVLIEVPKGMEVEGDGGVLELLGEVNIADKMAQAAKTTGKRMVSKVKISKSKKCCLATTEVKGDQQSHLNQILMLNPAEEEGDANLEMASHGLDAHMKISVLPDTISHKKEVLPSSNNIVRQKQVSKRIFLS